MPIANLPGIYMYAYIHMYYVYMYMYTGMNVGQSGPKFNPASVDLAPKYSVRLHILFYIYMY